ncbi:hypothetical protein SteCoe_22096 [Stentor coeruleus]|uniref:Uncharacterized protein n=1 Tax=Stentor coeruleus TaxID=5963 RepID=A0A1R2BN19_9CILI|nr:hypothetical protein SteCoe_22096 [Stentor coeruleus]
METPPLQLENEEAKAKRKKIIEQASNGCEEVQREIQNWKIQKPLPSSTSFPVRSPNTEIFNDKVEEIMKKLSTNRSKSKEKVKESYSAHAIDLKASLHSSLLNQEILKKQYHLLIEKHEIETKSLKDKIGDLQQQVQTLKYEKAKKYEENLAKAENQLRISEENSKNHENRLNEKQNEIDLLRATIVDRDKIIDLMEKKAASMESGIIAFKDKEFELNSVKIALEKEKKRREIAENEYKLLVDEVKSLNERSCMQIKNEYEERIRKLVDNVRSLESRLSNTNPTEKTVHFTEMSKLTPIPEEAPCDSLKRARFYEEKCENLYKDMQTWKEKSFVLTEKFFPALKSVRGELDKFKQECLNKQQKLKKLFDKSVNDLTNKYHEDLEEKERALAFYKSKAEGLENRKSGKIKTCKGS